MSNKVWPCERWVVRFAGLRSGPGYTRDGLVITGLEPLTNTCSYDLCCNGNVRGSCCCLQGAASEPLMGKTCPGLPGRLVQLSVASWLGELRQTLKLGFAEAWPCSTYTQMQYWFTNVDHLSLICHGAEVRQARYLGTFTGQEGRYSRGVRVTSGFCLLLSVNIFHNGPCFKLAT